MLTPLSQVLSITTCSNSGVSPVQKSAQHSFHLKLKQTLHFHHQLPTGGLIDILDYTQRPQTRTSNETRSVWSATYAAFKSFGSRRHNDGPVSQLVSRGRFYDMHRQESQNLKKKKKEKSCSNGFCVKFDLAICIFSANKVKNLFMKRKAFVTEWKHIVSVHNF